MELVEDFFGNRAQHRAGGDFQGLAFLTDRCGAALEDERAPKQGRFEAFL